MTSFYQREGLVRIFSDKKTKLILKQFCANTILHTLTHTRAEKT